MCCGGGGGDGGNDGNGSYITSSRRRASNVWVSFVTFVYFTFDEKRANKPLMFLPLHMNVFPKSKFYF